MTRRGVMPVLVAGVLLLAGGTPAGAYWQAPGVGSGQNSADVLSAPTISVPSTSSGSVGVSFTAQSSLTTSTGANGDITYTVERMAAGGSFAAISSGDCSGSLPRGTNSCTDTLTSNGTYTYRAVAHFHTWTATSATAGPVAVNVDSTPPTVTVNQALGQGDPASATPIHFSAAFSESVHAPPSSAVTIGGTAGHGSATVTVTEDGDDRHYDIAVSQLSSPDGTVTVSLPAGATTDLAGNASLASTSTDNTVTYDSTLHAPTAVTLANGGGTSNAYINAANKAAVNVDVTLDATSASSDTVALKLSDGNSAHDVAPASKSGTSGAGTVHFTNIDTSGLSDGPITSTATATDVAGNTPASKAANVTKDVLAPLALTSASFVNGKSATGTGTYISLANVSSTQWSIGIASNTRNSATDTIAVSLTGTGGTASGSAAAGVASGTAIVTLDASALGQGNVNLTATSTDLAGNASSSFSSSSIATKDTVSPSNPSGNTSKYTYVQKSSTTPDQISGANGSLVSGDLPKAVEVTPSAGRSFVGAAAVANGSFAAFNVDAISTPSTTVTYDIFELDPAGNQSSGSTRVSFTNSG